MFPFAEYLHSMTCSSLMPRYVGSGMSWPLGLVVYPIARIRYGLWRVGLCCSGKMYSGIVCGWFDIPGLSFCPPLPREDFLGVVES